MKINNISTTDFGALPKGRVTYGYSNVTSYGNWLRRAKSPKHYETTEQYSTCTIKLVFKGKNRLENSSNLLAEMRYSQIDFENESPWDFLGAIKGEPKFTYVNFDTIEVEVTMEGVKISKEERPDIIFDANGDATLVPKGNLDVETTFVIIPNADISELTLTVNGVEYKLLNLVSGNRYCISGRLGKSYYYDANDKYHNNIRNYTSYDFPVLNGGKSNTISVGDAIKSLERVYVIYEGRWM